MLIGDLKFTSRNSLELGHLWVDPFAQKWAPYQESIGFTEALNCAQTFISQCLANLSQRQDDALQVVDGVLSQ